MNVSIKQIRAFVAVANTGSFAQAGEVVHLSQPALSIAIKNLEETVGGKLLVRSTRMHALTHEGEKFLPIARCLLADWDGALSDLNNSFSLHRGKLALAAMPSFASTELPAFIKHFSDEYPKINITIHDVIAEDAIDMVRSGKVELAISFQPSKSDDLLFSPLFSDDFIVALPREHPLINEQQLSWQAVAQYPFIALQKPSNIRKLIDETLMAENIALSVAFETNQLETMAQMVSVGLGLSVMPSLYINKLKALAVECRILSTPKVSRKVGIISRRRFPLSSAAQALSNMITESYNF